MVRVRLITLLYLLIELYFVYSASTPWFIVYVCTKFGQIDISLLFPGTIVDPSYIRQMRTQLMGKICAKYVLPQSFLETLQKYHDIDAVLPAAPHAVTITQ